MSWGRVVKTPLPQRYKQKEKPNNHNKPPPPTLTKKHNTPSDFTRLKSCLQEEKKTSFSETVVIHLQGKKKFMRKKKGQMVK